MLSEWMLVHETDVINTNIFPAGSDHVERSLPHVRYQ
jgi:hypothetical protein